MKWTVEQMPSQAGRTAVVTGANSGLGLETAIALAGSGARVVMACRNPDKAAAALARVRERVPQAEAELMTLDLSSLASVRAFAAAFRQRHEEEGWRHDDRGEHPDQKPHRIFVVRAFRQNVDDCVDGGGEQNQAQGEHVAGNLAQNLCFSLSPLGRWG